jgi:hypothetical protein
MSEQQYYAYNIRDAREGYMDKCIVWWRAEGRGYTNDLNDAGMFTDADREKNYPPTDRCIYVPVEIAEKVARTWRGAWHEPIVNAMEDAGIEITVKGYRR